MQEVLKGILPRAVGESSRGVERGESGVVSSDIASVSPCGGIGTGSMDGIV